MQHLFISYSHVDGYFVDALKQHFEQYGYTSWIDAEDIRGGRNWKSEIDKAIRTAFVRILVLSPEFVKSEYVIYEWSFALAIGIEVIPILLRDVEHRHPRLDGIQDISFTDRYCKHLPWEKLYSAIDSAKLDYEERQKARNAISLELLNAMIEQLDSSDFNLRRSVATVLGLIANPLAVDVLIRHIIDDHPEVRVAVIRALGSIADSRATEPILASFDDKIFAVRLACTDALTQIGQPAIPALCIALKNRNASKTKGVARSRINAIVVLERIASQDTIVPLLDALHDDDPVVVGVAVSALGSLKAVEAVPLLVKLLDRRERVWFFKSKVRLDELAAASLKMIATDEAKAALQGWLYHQEWVSKENFQSYLNSL